MLIVVSHANVTLKINKKIPISGSTKKQIKVGFKTPQAITLPRGQYTGVIHAKFFGVFIHISGKSTLSASNMFCQCYR
jgi:sRNA-binding carbon storage regulator CsrA